MIRLTNRGRRAWAGRMFILPWLAGAVVLGVVPLVQSFYYTFHEMTFQTKGFLLSPVGAVNYTNAFVLDAYVLEYFGQTISAMLANLPLILLFSLFSAVILNRRFKGRTLVRSVFFFPVIVTSGALIYVLRTETSSIRNASSAAIMLSNMGIEHLLRRTLGNSPLIRQVVQLMDNVFDIIWRSGVQILLFLAGLQSINPSLYESADVEGATGWEKFWKITVPLVSPIILVNIIYTVVDSFTDYNNSMLRYVITTIFGKVQYTYGTTLAWIYFAAIFLILLTMIGIVSRSVYYSND